MPSLSIKNGEQKVRPCFTKHDHEHITLDGNDDPKWFIVKKPNMSELEEYKLGFLSEDKLIVTKGDSGRARRNK